MGISFKMVLPRVDFPQPDSPTSPRVSPLWIVRLISSTALTTAGFKLNRPFFVRTSVEESGDDGQEADNTYPILNGQIPASEGHGLWKEQGSGAWKFLKDKDGYAQKEWLKIGEDWYLFGDNSIMITGWSLVNQTWYYSGGSGAMLTGWQFINGSWYYLKPDGSMAVGWLEADGKWYYLRPDGSCLINGVTPDGYRVDGNGVWDGNEK